MPPYYGRVNPGLRVSARPGARKTIRASGAPALLCHCTTLAGLRGILTKQVFRATDHHDVDDKGELKAAEERVDATLVEVASNASPLGADVFASFRRSTPSGGWAVS